MQKFLFKTILAVGVLAISATGLTSCSSRAHCPGVAGTGNSASLKGGHRKPHCTGTASTGNFKPKVRNRKEDGLTSRKMERVMAKKGNSSSGTSTATPQE